MSNPDVLERTHSGEFECSLRPLERALEKLRILAVGGTVLAEADGDTMRLTADNGLDLLSVAVPASRAFESAAFGYDEFDRVVRAVASEWRAGPDDRQVAIHAGIGNQPVLEVDGLTVYGPPVSAEEVPATLPHVEIVAEVERASFVAAIKEHRTNEPSPPCCLAVDIASGRLLVGSGDHRAMIVSAIPAGTGQLEALAGRSEVNAGIVSTVASGWRAETVEIGFLRGREKRLEIVLRCGETTLRTMVYSHPSRASDHLRLALGTPAAATVRADCSTLLAAVNRCMGAVPAWMPPHPVVALTVIGSTFVVIPADEDRPASMAEAGALLVDAVVETVTDWSSVAVDATQFISALELLESNSVELRLHQTGMPVIVADAGSPLGRRVAIEPAVKCDDSPF